MIRIRSFLNSMTGRLFLILALGVGAAAFIAIAVTDAANRRAFELQLTDRAVDRLQGYVAFLDASPANLRALILSAGGPGFHVQPAEARGTKPDPEFQTLMRARGELLQNATAETADYVMCFPEIRNFATDDVRRALASEEFRRALARASPQRMRPRLQSLVNMIPPVCRLISVQLSDGTPLRFSMDTPWVQRERGRLVDPAFVTMLALAIVILSYFVARLASAPLKRLAKAAAELGRDLDRAPV
jgi:hypothetical protein